MSMVIVSGMNMSVLVVRVMTVAFMRMSFMRMVMLPVTGGPMPAAAACAVAMPFMGVVFRLRIHGGTGH